MMKRLPLTGTKFKVPSWMRLKRVPDLHAHGQRWTLLKDASGRCHPEEEFWVLGLTWNGLCRRGEGSAWSREDLKRFQGDRFRWCREPQEDRSLEAYFDE